jgi:lipid-binding SYLF domain-containing protein
MPRTQGWARFTWLVLILPIVVACATTRSASDDARDAQQVVERAKMTLDNFLADKDVGPPLHALLKRAKGVLIYPQVLRGAFVVGASGGSGALLVQDQATHRWGGPAFYTIGEVSLGLQIGGDAQEVVLVILSDRGIAPLFSRSAKLGVGTGIAIGPIGYGAEAATANLSADIISYARGKGLYVGVSVEGAVVEPRDSLNAAYYGRTLSPSDILIRHAVASPHAAPLLNALAAAAK